MTSNQHALQVTPAFGESISCTIRGDETIRRTNDDGTPFIEVLIDDDEHTRTEQPAIARNHVAPGSLVRSVILSDADGSDLKQPSIQRWENEGGEITQDPSPHSK